MRWTVLRATSSSSAISAVVGRVGPIRHSGKGHVARHRPNGLSFPDGSNDGSRIQPRSTFRGDLSAPTQPREPGCCSGVTLAPLLSVVVLSRRLRDVLTKLPAGRRPGHIGSFAGRP